MENTLPEVAAMDHELSIDTQIAYDLSTVPDWDELTQEPVLQIHQEQNCPCLNNSSSRVSASQSTDIEDDLFSFIETSFESLEEYSTDAPFLDPENLLFDDPLLTSTSHSSCPFGSSSSCQCFSGLLTTGDFDSSNSDLFCSDPPFFPSPLSSLESITMDMTSTPARPTNQLRLPRPVVLRDLFDSSSSSHGDTFDSSDDMNSDNSVFSRTEKPCQTSIDSLELGSESQLRMDTTGNNELDLKENDEEEEEEEEDACAAWRNTVKTTLPEIPACSSPTYDAFLVV